MRGLKRLGCNAGHQEVSRSRTRGEAEESIARRQERKQVYKGSTVALKPRAGGTRSPNRGISDPTKGLVSSNYTLNGFTYLLSQKFYHM